MSETTFEADVITAPAGLAVFDAAIVGVAMMDESEAREYLKMMQWDLEAADSALTNFRARAVDFAEREGWRALGYGGALEALQNELGAQYSKSYLSRILQAGEIERVLDLPIGQLPERTLRPLAQLDTPDQQRQAYQAATQNGKPTASKVQQSVDQIKLPDLTSFGFSIRELPDGRIAIRSEGNLESEHAHAQLNDLIAHWRGYPPIPADLAVHGVVWRYRQDKMYQVMCGEKIGQTGYTTAECLTRQRESMERTGVLPAAAETDDSAIKAQIRERAASFGLELIWEDDKVIMYWPDEADDLDQMDMLSYDVAMEWLNDAAPGLAALRAEVSTKTLSGEYEAKEETDLILIGKAEQAITSGDTKRARGLLDQVEVSTWKRDQLLATIPAGRRITLAFTDDDCAALLREAKAFEQSGLITKLPAIGQALVLLVQGIRGAM